MNFVNEKKFGVETYLVCYVKFERNAFLFLDSTFLGKPFSEGFRNKSQQ